MTFSNTTTLSNQLKYWWLPWPHLSNMHKNLENAVYCECSPFINVTLVPCCSNPLSSWIHWTGPSPVLEKEKRGSLPMACLIKVSRGSFPSSAFIAAGVAPMLSFATGIDSQLMVHKIKLQQKWSISYWHPKLTSSAAKKDISLYAGGMSNACVVYLHYGRQELQKMCFYRRKEKESRKSEYNMYP